MFYLRNPNRVKFISEFEKKLQYFRQKYFEKSFKDIYSYSAPRTVSTNVYEKKRKKIA